MSIQIYNSLSRKKEPFKPQKPPKVNIYTCGVTVYDECHIGHARSLYIFDVIRRYLEYKGYKVNFVRNITDIDDKIINRANELKVDWRELVKKYIVSYNKDLKSLGIRLGVLDKDKEEPRATKSIEDIKKYIKALIDKGYAYATGTGVYFSVRKFKDYGKLSGQSIDQMLTGVRKESDETKNDPLDFALWKKSKEGEPKWKSPWGEGRPGWHIECSVMSQKYLKADTLDIHAGGRDLIFPHHENEIAQAEAKTGKQFAKYWIHHGLLTINGQKMSKSLGNFITIKKFIDENKDTDILKLFFLTTRYSNPIDFTQDIIKQKREALNNIIRVLDNIKKAEKGKYPDTGEDNPSEIMSVEQFEKKVDSIRGRFEFRMDDNFDTPRAIAVIFGIVSSCRLALYGSKEYLPGLKKARKTILELGIILGLRFESGSLPVPEEEIEKLIEFRQKLKQKKLYKEADKVRAELEKVGIILEDTKGGKTAWRRKI